MERILSPKRESGSSPSKKSMSLKSKGTNPVDIQTHLNNLFDTLSVENDPLVYSNSGFINFLVKGTRVIGNADSIKLYTTIVKKIEAIAGSDKVYIVSDPKNVTSPYLYSTLKAKYIEIDLLNLNECDIFVDSAVSKTIKSL